MNSYSWQFFYGVLVAPGSCWVHSFIKLSTMLKHCHCIERELFVQCLWRVHEETALYTTTSTEEGLFLLFNNSDMSQTACLLQPCSILDKYAPGHIYTYIHNIIHRLASIVLYFQWFSLMTILNSRATFTLLTHKWKCIMHTAGRWSTITWSTRNLSYYNSLIAPYYWIPSHI